MKILPLALFQCQKTNLGLNFMREIKRDVQKYTWNRVTKIGAVITQAGTPEGIENITSNTSFIPYIRLLPAR
jgi:hypothetical protein